MAPALPGPLPGQVWVEDRGHPSEWQLVDLDGIPTGKRVPSPARHEKSVAVPDAAGYVLVQTEHGAFDLRPSVLRGVTMGSVVAMGPTRWLIRPCGYHRKCKLAVVDRRTGTQRSVPPVCSRGLPALPLSGTISVNGRTAAIPCPGSDGELQLHLLDLPTGRQLRLQVHPQTTNGSNLVWSPDIRWLFVINHDGHLTAINRHTGEIRTLTAHLPPLAQLAS